MEFNGKRIKLYDNGKLTVADAAVQSEFSNEDLFPKRGRALTFSVNGKSRIVRGVQGEAALIRVNGENADIHSQVHNGDHIEMVPSTAGDEAVLELGKLTELSEQLHVIVNGTKINLPKTALVNGKMENEFYLIREEDEITVQNSYTVREIADFMDVPLGGGILVNDTPAKPETRIYENFTLSWNAETDETEELSGADGPAEAVSGTPAESTVGVGSNTAPEAGNTGENTRVTVIVNGMPVALTGKVNYVFVDVFSFIEFDLSKPAGRNIVTRLNGRNAEYMEPLNEGDVLEIYWEV